jgi:hypothetical protein
VWLFVGCVVWFGGFAGPFDGNWATDCTKEQSQYTLGTMTMSGNTIQQTSAAYGDQACATKTLEATVAYTAQYGSDSKVVTGAKEVDTILSSVMLTVHNATYISYFNSMQFCGYSDWAVGVAKDIAGKTCGQTTLPKVGTAYYDIYQLLQTGKLLTGQPTKEYNGSSPELRVRQLDEKHPYTKK